MLQFQKGNDRDRMLSLWGKEEGSTEVQIKVRKCVKRCVVSMWAKRKWLLCEQPASGVPKPP